MAWQAHGGGPGDGGPGGGLPGGMQQPAGTEYTLQGVMRFLQTEWHRHERERNQWEIERAEMRARIAKLEGENSASKRLQAGYLKRMRMLENMLKQERSKAAGGLVNGATADQKQEDDANKDPVMDLPPIALRSEEARKKSRLYLDECLKEITYLLLPPNHPPPPAGQLDSVAGAVALLDQHLPPPPPPSQPPQHQQQLHQQQQQQQQQFQQQRFPEPQPRGAPVDFGKSFQPPPVSILSHDNTKQNNNLYEPRDNKQHHNAAKQASMEVQNAISGSNLDEPVETVSHSFDSFGEPLDATGESSRPISRGTVVEYENGGKSEEALDDAWDFDDGKSTNVTTPESTKSTDQPKNASSRRKSMSRRRLSQETSLTAYKTEPGALFKVKFALRGHLDVIRSITFTGGGSGVEPEICTTGDDGVIKRWTIPGGYMGAGTSDVDVTCNFTHRGHIGMVTSLASSHSASFSGGLSNDGEGWIFSGGMDATVKVWQKGQVDARATLIGHTDAVWAVCVLPLPHIDDLITLVSGAADGTVRIWTVTPPVKTAHNSVRSTQAQYLASTPKDEFSYHLVTTIKHPNGASPTSIAPLSPAGENFIVSYNDASVIIYDTHTGEQLAAMDSLESYDGTPGTGVSAVVATTLGISDVDTKEGIEEEAIGGGVTGGRTTGVVIAGTEDRYINFYDANSGQCSYRMLAHPAAISSLALQAEYKMLVSAGHDGTLRVWDLEKRACIQEFHAHRSMRGEGANVVVWSSDGRWIVSGGGDGVVKVYAR